MGELRSFSVTAALILLAGLAAHRAFGVAADPFTGLAIFTVAHRTWLAYRRRQAGVRRAVAELRAYAVEDRLRIVDSLDSDELRKAIAAEMLRDGAETSDGVTETFPFPEVLRRRANRRYWRDWLGAGVAILVAALYPSINPIWRALWLAVGLILLVRARRFDRWHTAVSSFVEINPYRISLVWPTGARETVSFADGAWCEDSPDQRMFFVRSRDAAVAVSYSLIGFNRIAELVEKYGARIPIPDAPAS
jgi:hypothetical protein